MYYVYCLRIVTFVIPLLSTAFHGVIYRTVAVCRMSFSLNLARSRIVSIKTRHKHVLLRIFSPRLYTLYVYCLFSRARYSSVLLAMKITVLRTAVHRRFALPVQYTYTQTSRGWTKYIIISYNRCFRSLCTLSYKSLYPYTRKAIIYFFFKFERFWL